MREPEEPWTQLARLVPYAAAFAYAAIGFVFLHVGQPADDAYILFRYVENFVAGHGIVFNPGGPHVEGATDFLWFLAISGLRRLGLDVAYAALLLNAAGAWLASALCVSAVSRAGVRGASGFAIAVLSLAVVIVAGAPAGYLGFSSMLYAALATWLFALAIEEPAGGGRSPAWIPPLALALALFRPDGAILAVGFGLVGLVRARQAGALQPYLRSALAAIALGAVYFAWRWTYFGFPLPLPLYVKGHSAAHSGIGDAFEHPLRFFRGLTFTWWWARGSAGPAPLLLAIAVFVAACVRDRARAVRAFAIGYAPFLALLLVLSLGHQTQNIAFRFQAPAQLALVFGAFAWAGRACAARSTSRARAAIVTVLALALVPGIRAGAGQVSAALTQRHYLDTFASDLRGVLRPVRTIVLTEAGRVPYWSGARVEDAIGLNNPRTAFAPPSVEWVREVDPDLVQLYADPRLFGFVRRLQPGNRSPVELDPQVLRDVPDPELRPVSEHGLEQYDGNLDPEVVASIVLARFLADTPGYDVVAVPLERDRWHVWGVRRSLPEAREVLEALRASFAPDAFASYADLARRPR